MKQRFFLFAFFTFFLAALAFGLTPEVKVEFYYKAGYLGFRHKVESEAHLLELMGVKSYKELNQGQKSLLLAYKTKDLKTLKAEAKYAYQPRTVQVVLTDTSSTFSPYAKGSEIHLGSGYFNNKDWKSSREIFVHEYTHTLDSTQREADGYGKDGQHLTQEIIKPKAAFLEGFANFNMILCGGKKMEDFFRGELTRIGGLAREKNDGGYFSRKVDYYGFPIGDARHTAEDLLNVESVIALVLNDLAREIKPGGPKLIFEAFKRTHDPNRTFKDFLLDFAKNNPEHIETIAKVLDRETLTKFSKGGMEGYLGKTSALDAYFGKRKAVKRKFAASFARSIPFEGIAEILNAPAEAIPGFESVQPPSEAPQPAKPAVKKDPTVKFPTKPGEPQKNMPDPTQKD